MSFNQRNMNKWPRKENNIRMYPAFTWVISKEINELKEFRMSYDEEGNGEYYDKINPCYSALNDETKVMADSCTEYRGMI